MFTAKHTARTLARKLVRERFTLPRFTSIGSYTIGYYDLREGDVYCAPCATFERFTRALTADVYWEGPAESCASCSDSIHSSYGDPDERNDPPADVHEVARDLAARYRANGDEGHALMLIAHFREHAHVFAKAWTQRNAAYASETLHGGYNHASAQDVLDVCAGTSTDVRLPNTGRADWRTVADSLAASTDPLD